MNKLLRTLAIAFTLLNSHICFGQDYYAVVANYKGIYYAMTNNLINNTLKPREVIVVNNKVINETDIESISWQKTTNNYVSNPTFGIITTKKSDDPNIYKSETKIAYQTQPDNNGTYWIDGNNRSPIYHADAEGFKNYSKTMLKNSGYARGYLMTFSDGYTRTITINEGYKWGTICMPNAVNAGDFAGATFYSIVGKESADNTVTALVLKEEENLEAGMPYIFKATANIVAAYTGESVSEPTNNNGLYGVLSGTVTISGDEGFYGIANNKVNPLGAGATIPANRAYIRMNEVPEYTENTAEAKVIRFDMNEATKIISTTMDDEEVYFNLKGQRVIEPKNGIYIKNGKKVLIK